MKAIKRKGIGGIVSATLLMIAPWLQAAELTGSGDLATVEGNMQLGQFQFSVEVAGDVTIAAGIEGYNSFIYLYDMSSDQPIAENDNDPNSFSLDSYLALDLAAGDYMLAIGPSFYGAAEGLAGERIGVSHLPFALTGEYENSGSWSVAVNTTEVPVPAAFPLFAAALAGLISLRRKYSV